MEKASFFSQAKSSLESASSLVSAEKTLLELVNATKQQGKILGFVVGKITPTGGETLDENKSILTKNTEKISKLVEEKGIVVFSSAVIPDAIEGKFPIEDFYKIFDGVVRDHIKILFTTDGWEKSKGAVGEVEIAKNNGIEIFNFSKGKLSPLV